MGNLPETEKEAVLEARRRLGFSDKTVRNTHTSLMAHYNVIFNKLGILSPKKIRSNTEEKIRKPRRISESKSLSDKFLLSYEWRRLRYSVICKYKSCCMACGRSPNKDGITLHVDHIQPRKLRPDLALDPDNLQVLCHECNHGKGNWDTTDWRC